MGINGVGKRLGEDGLVRVVEDLTTRLQAGEPVDVEAHVHEHPAYAERLRDLLPALGLLADLGQAPVAEEPPGSAPPPPAGRLGDFRLGREVGRGGMGVVYEAEQVSPGRRVALKVLPFAATLDPRRLQRCHNEARAAAGLHHTNIVPVYAVGCEHGVHYYAMQFIDGQTLAQVIADLRAPTADGKQPADVDAATGPYVAGAPGPVGDGRAATGKATAVALSTERAGRGREYYRTLARLGIQAAEALEHAHQLGVVHRDVKPSPPPQEQLRERP